MKQGFTLFELMIVVAILALLSMLSVPHLMRTLAKAKRSEAYVYLRSLADAQKMYYAENGSYTRSFKEIGWHPEGAHSYTYGFPGTVQGEGHVVGSLGTPSGLLRGTVSSTGFTVSAVGMIYGDTPDILTIDQSGTIEVVQDALA